MPVANHTKLLSNHRIDRGAIVKDTAKTCKLFGKMGKLKLFTVILIIFLFVKGYSAQSKDGETLIENFSNLISDEDNYTMHDMEKLIKDKRAIANRFVRPKKDQAKPLIIHTAFSLAALRGLEEVNEKISICGGFLLNWVDERMAWNLSEYGGIKTFTIENQEFWTPLIILGNAYEQFEKIGSADYWLIRFTNTGQASFTPSDVFTATCSIDVTLYPWDTQECIFQFLLWSIVREEIQFTVIYEKIDTTYFSEHSEWDIIDTSVSTAYNNVAVDVKLTLKRKPLFVVVNIVLPIIFMSALNMMVFVIPTESGERFSYGMTVLLAIAVFLTIISDNLPRSGKNLPVLCFYLVSLLVYGVLIVIGMTLSMRVYFTPEDEDVPTWCARLVVTFKCRKHKHKQKNGKYQNGRRINEEHGPDSDNNVSRPSTDTNGKTSDYGKSDKTGGKDNSVTWKDVSSVMDTIFFHLSWIILSIFTIVFFVYVID